MALIGHNVYPKKKKPKALPPPKTYHCSWCGYTTAHVWRIIPPASNHKLAAHYRKRAYCSARCVAEDFYIGRRYNKRGNPIDLA